MDLFHEAKKIEAQIILWRRELHAIPELRMDTPKTAAIIMRILREIGITDIRAGVGGHGVAAMIYGAHPGKCLGIRADCDGLPIPEETGLSFASKNGNSHACGHDAHTAMALGAARLIYQNRENLHGSVKLIFQPYEEGDGGAKAMIADGVLENPKVDSIIAMHTGTIMGPQYENGDVIISERPVSACIYACKATFHGKSTHVCTPELGLDPIYMASLATVRIKEMFKKERKPDEPVIMAVTTIHGGVRNNVIPGDCAIEASLRSFDNKRLEHLKRLFRDTCQNVAKEQMGRVEMETLIDLMSTTIDKGMFDQFKTVAKTIVSEKKIKLLEKAPPSGEDFARFADLIPGFYFYLCSKPEGEIWPHHHPKFDINENTLATGAALFTAFALTTCRAENHT